jgi:glycosyltransferase involved in cell wall biosynthesis
MGFEVCVIARAFKDSLPLAGYPFKAERIKCFFRRGFLQYAEFNTRLFFRLLFRRTDYFLANDLDTLVPNYLVSRLRRKKIFYDTHEYFTGVPELSGSPLKRKIWKFFEDRVFPKLPVVYTVNESVKNKYREEYGIEIGVIRNVPETVPIIPKEVPPHWLDKHVLLMQGIGINPGRGGLELLEVMKYLPANYLLVYIGGGTEWDTIRSKRKEWQLEDRVEMISKIPPSELKGYTPLASLGFTLDGFENLNYLFNLPNKIFDYLHAGVPVVATPIPEVKNIIEQYECGVCLLSQEPREIAGQILTLMNDPQQYQFYKTNALAAAKELCWEKEEQKLIDIYRPYL